MKITITEWAALNYDPPPSAWVLAEWRRKGQIWPPPERVGRVWYVELGTTRIPPEHEQWPKPTLVDRLRISEQLEELRGKRK